MKIKVCGIKIQSQFDALVNLGVEMIGLNYYKHSQRYVDTHLNVMSRQSTLVTGVFVDEPLESLKRRVEEMQLDYVQLHGNEDIRYCKAARQLCPVIKVVKVQNEIDNSLLIQYEPFVDYFLFDTYTAQYGGSGKKFNWDLISDLQISQQIILSGGIRQEDDSTLREICHPQLWGVDINSRFEHSPGVKDLNQIEQFYKRLKDA